MKTLSSAASNDSLKRNFHFATLFSLTITEFKRIIFSLQFLSYCILCNKYLIAPSVLFILSFIHFAIVLYCVCVGWGGGGMVCVLTE